MALRRGLSQNRGQVSAGVSLQHGVGDRREGSFVEKLSRVDHLQADSLLHPHDRLRGLPDRTEIDHGAGLVRGDLESLHRDGAQEGERSLGTHQKVGDDVERILESHQWKEVQTSDILNGIFILYPLSKLLILNYFFPQSLNRREELRMSFPEFGFGRLIPGVEDCPIGEYYPGRDHRLVGVRMGSAAHSGSVVHHDSPDHARTYRCRVGSESPPEWL